MKKLTKLALLSYSVLLISFSCRENNNEPFNSSSTEVPLAGNAFITTQPNEATEEISDEADGGLKNWTNPNTVISTYFRVSKSGDLTLGLKAKVPNGNSTIKVTVNGISKNISITGPSYSSRIIGNFNVPAGYVKVDLQGVTKTGSYFADVSHILFSGTAASGTNVFSNMPEYYYWSRRGPSCHLSYTIPTPENISYYYNEVTVPTGQDKIGSYFMVSGFKEGYFGIQVNSATERRILFSVWSPFETDNPDDIPEDKKVKLLKIGTGVTTNQFGGEGAGGQSYYKYNWAAGKTYKFLLKGEPDGNNNTIYTAWFLTPENSNWKLIASWKRPYTNTYLTNFHSFVENFEPENGYLERSATFKNQWIRTQEGTWKPLSTAKFSVDATYKNAQRIDAIGGTKDGNTFTLQNGGFFNTIVDPGSQFTITPPSTAPNINLSTLP